VVDGHGHIAHERLFAVLIAASGEERLARFGDAQA
jgi:hypothetical protein